MNDAIEGVPTSEHVAAAKRLFDEVFLNRRMILVRALIWRSTDGFEISQAEVVKLHHTLDRTRLALSHFGVNVEIDFPTNRVHRINRFFRMHDRRDRKTMTSEDAVDELATIVLAWSRKDDLLLGQQTAPNPWIEAKTPFFGNVFCGPNFRTTVPACHPDMLPLLTMCMTAMHEMLIGSEQGMNGEMLGSFGSFIVQTRREAMRNTYGSYF
ncbi:MAG: hypothetical protein WC217_00550 [Candidatus Paceibacterota bacterium]|jgi:hypothetical protein